MIVSWNWLTDYVRLDMSVEKLAQRLALSGLNHEATEEVGGDLAIDLEVTSNRPDCLCHLGVAREIAAVFGRALAEPNPQPRETGPDVRETTGVTVDDPRLCPRFTARVITGATVGDSPWWLRKRLETLGVRPVSNIVDITNYVMFECGQPLHAYDLDRLDERRLIVRNARPGESLRAINGKTYELDQRQLVIADARRPVGLAGVMGGLDSEIGPSTRNVLIESAQFDMMSVRRTARALGLNSPSSFRFERPMDPERTEWASRRCAELTLELAGGTLHRGVIDVAAPRPTPQPITLRLDQLPRILGVAIDAGEVVRIFRSLGLEILAETERTVTVRPPSWRADLEREVDLVEEAARIHGYHNIPEDRPVAVARSSRTPRERVESLIRAALTGMGLDEACTFSLVSDELAEPLAPGEAPPPLRVDHPTRRREAALRRSLVPSLLAVRASNAARGTPDASLFEIADVYLPRAEGEIPDQPSRLALVAGCDYLGIKGIIEGLLDALHAAGETRAEPVDSPLFEHGRAARLTLNGHTLGYLGEIAGDRLERFELRDRCAAAELDLATLIDCATLIPQARALPAFPSVARDLSLVLDRGVPWEALAATATRAGGPLLAAVEFHDTFDLPDGKHSLHFGMRFLHPERTLTGDEVERAVQAIVASCTESFGAALR